MSEIICWTLAWSNPYTSPPDGMPRVLVEQVLPRGVKPEEVYRQHVLGSPYGIHLPAMPAQGPRQLSLEAKQRIRRKALRRRIERDVPLFATEVLQRQLAKKLEYFGID